MYLDDFSATNRMELSHELENCISNMISNEAFSNIPNLGVLAKKMLRRITILNFL